MWLDIEFGHSRGAIQVDVPRRLSYNRLIYLSVGSIHSGGRSFGGWFRKSSVWLGFLLNSFGSGYLARYGLSLLQIEEWALRVHRHGADVVVQAPAKLNLFFEVLARRIDGYHEIETLVYPINLYDTLYFREHSREQVELGLESVSGVWESDDSGSLVVPRGTDNLVVAAVELLRRRAGISRGASLRLVKRIPSAAGLGGGSSDAAAALVAGNVGWNLGLSQVELVRLAAELGSDVPLFLFDGPTFCRGRGELVEPRPGLGLLHFVVVRPPVGLSTAKVYDTCKAARAARCPAALLGALGRGDLWTAGRSLFNRLELAAGTLSPWIGRLRREFSRMDCLGYQMSGSGSCYFGLCRHSRHARRVARRLQAGGVGTAFVVRGSR